ncbi:hypothetical protein GWK47_041269 [Chionoecetes opilio]|uniref:Uncharacterized protein n=1 Tax=Chionoecetes opilio TaxID=41210 RepID=A0A8J4YIN8_CHIOP|nr:hypothetical protein GWK47_041269 [Chionoecetes opilio]
MVVVNKSLFPVYRAFLFSCYIPRVNMASQKTIVNFFKPVNKRRDAEDEHSVSTIHSVVGSMPSDILLGDGNSFGANPDYEVRKKAKRRQSEGDKVSDALLQGHLASLFDIAAPATSSMIHLKQKDKDFLDDQRGQRKMVMSTVDKESMAKESRKHERLAAERRRKEKELAETLERGEMIEWVTGSSATAECADSSTSSSDTNSSHSTPTPGENVIKKVKQADGTENSAPDTAEYWNKNCSGGSQIFGVTVHRVFTHRDTMCSTTPHRDCLNKYENQIHKVQRHGRHR